MSRSLRLLSFVSSGAIAMALMATSASAQEYGYGPPGPYYNNQGEEVIVTAPPYHPRERSEIGAPIEDVAMQREVRFDDLDLNTYWGMERLRSRIAFTARTMCNQLDTLYPVSADGDSSQTCYRRAYDDAMYQAHQAVRAARAGDGYYGYDGQ